MRILMMALPAPMDLIPLLLRPQLGGVWSIAPPVCPRGVMLRLLA